MKCLPFLLIMLAIGESTEQKQAKETHTIKIKELLDGESRRIEGERGSTQKTVAHYADFNGSSSNTSTSSWSSQFVFTETILDWPEGAAMPTKLRRSYDKAIGPAFGPPTLHSDFLP